MHDAEKSVDETGDCLGAVLGILFGRVGNPGKRLCNAQAIPGFYPGVIPSWG